MYENIPLPKQHVFKVNRIPIEVRDGKVVYMEQEFFIYIANREYIGGTYIVIEPDKPIVKMDVEVELEKEESWYEY